MFIKCSLNFYENKLTKTWANKKPQRNKRKKYFSQQDVSFMISRNEAPQTLPKAGCVTVQDAASKT